jgi:transcriptional regulator with XRE-family HTH domain
MTSRVGPIRRATRVATEDETRVRADLVRARQGSGLSRESVARACGLSRTVVERIEAGSRPTTIHEFAAFGAVVGLDVRLPAYPAGDPIRDVGQARLLGRFRPRLHPSLGWATEVALPVEGGLRAWDALIRGARDETAVRRLERHDAPDRAAAGREHRVPRLGHGRHPEGDVLEAGSIGGRRQSLGHPLELMDLQGWAGGTVAGQPEMDTPSAAPGTPVPAARSSPR